MRRLPMTAHAGRAAQALLLAVLLPVGSARAQGVDLNGYVRAYGGVLTSGGGAGDYAVVQNTFDLRLERRTGLGALYVNPVLYHYPSRTHEPELFLRQAYIDVYTDRFDLRVGKQQIVWGKSDGVFITDVVSPKDLREFLLPDFQEIRVGVTGVSLNYYQGGSTIQAVWLPLFEPNRLPGPESLWSMPTPLFPAQVTIDPEREALEPKLENSQLFGRWSLLGSGVDLEVVGAWYLDPAPVYHLEPSGDAPGSGMTARAEHHRLLMGGGSAAWSAGGVILRGEAAYQAGRRFQAEVPSFPDGTMESDFLHYMLGADYSVLGVDVSGQFIQEVVLDHRPGILRRERTGTATLMLRDSLRRETLTLELFTYYGVDDEDALIRPRVFWDLADGYELQVGMNIFTGPASGTFGRFEPNDMVFTKLKLSF